MKKKIQNTIALALLIIGFTACNHHNSDIKPPHKARYEVVSVNDSAVEISVTYLHQKEDGIGNEIITNTEITKTPWQFDFTAYKPISLGVGAFSRSEHPDDRVHIIGRLYIDDELVQEQESDQYYWINILYHFE